MSGTTHVSQVVYNGIVAAAKLDAALTELIGTDQYPNALTGLHAELRDTLLMIPPTLGVVDADYDGMDGCVCPGPDTCAGPPCASVRQPLAPLDNAAVLWLAAISRVPIEERAAWVDEMIRHVEEINKMRAGR